MEEEMEEKMEEKINLVGGPWNRDLLKKKGGKFSLKEPGEVPISFRKVLKAPMIAPIPTTSGL